MTKEDYVKLIMERGCNQEYAEQEAEDIISNYLYPYESLDDYFSPNNMSNEQFEEAKQKMNDPNGMYEVL